MPVSPANAGKVAASARADPIRSRVPSSSSIASFRARETGPGRNPDGDERMVRSASAVSASAAASEEPRDSADGEESEKKS